ncbi:putative endopeptidase, partial [Escherichia coli O111:H11 str. CVM9455]
SRELADARAENETLRADVAAGRKRLRINATCSGTVREATGTSGVDNATAPDWQTPLNGIISSSENG